MLIQALGYVGVASSDLDRWDEFASSLIGAQRHDRTAGSLHLRLDDRLQRLTVDATLPPGGHVFGWEVANEKALARLAARLEAAAVAVKAGESAVADQRGVKDLIVFRDPAGNRLEAFHGPHLAASPFVPARPLSGFRTGRLGLGHAVLNVERIEPVLQFYRDVLQFQLSDFMLQPFRASFLHVNARHHSLALIETGNNGLHHVMLELLALDDVGQAYDIAQLRQDCVGVSLGRHSNDLMTSFYARSPSGFMIEYGWGGKAIDPSAWQAVELMHGPSLWGHERYWLPPDKRREALEMRLHAASIGMRAPVHVVNGCFVPAED